MSAATVSATTADHRESRLLVHSTTVNLTKTIIGAGVLCLPRALHDGGAAIGLASLAVTGFCSFSGFITIGYVCHLTGARTYREAWSKTSGCGGLLIDLQICFECFICCWGYAILMLDFIGLGLQGLLGLDLSRSLLAQLLALCLAPMCLKLHFHSLRFSSTLGMVAVLYMMIYVVLECASWLAGGNSLYFLNTLSSASSGKMAIFQATCVITSSYAAHQNAPDFLAELQRHPRPWAAFLEASTLSFGASFVAYSIFALAGFSRFRGEVQGNVLRNYEASFSVLLAWLAMGAMLLVSYPLQFKPARDAVAYGLKMPSDPGYPPWAMLSVSLMIVTLIAGVVFTDISRLLALRGALFACPLSFVLPGIMLLGIPAAKVAGAPHRGLAFLLMAFGAASGSLGLYTAITT